MLEDEEFKEPEARGGEVLKEKGVGVKRDGRARMLEA